MNNRALRVRVSGPLAAYADGFRAALAGWGYTPSSAAGQLQVMAHVSRWLAENDGDGRDLTPAAVEAFLRARRGAGYRRWRSGRGMARLLEYLRAVGVAPAPPPIGPETATEAVLSGYRDYLVHERGLAASTVRNYLEVARGFMATRVINGEPPLLAGLTAHEVSEFVLTGCRTRGIGSARLLVVGLRSLLRYLHLAGVTVAGLADAVPSAASWPASSLPEALQPEQARRLVESCDRQTVIGCRDFAVLTLMLRLGLRAGEVAALELVDIDWRHGEMVVHGKGNRAERLPLPADVGEALAGWLSVRSSVSAGRVFTTLLAPRGALTRKGVSAIVTRAAHRAGLRSVSAHRLRHCAATALLRAGASLPEVGLVLRHASMLSTARYAKVDHVALSVVARPWPVSAR